MFENCPQITYSFWNIFSFNSNITFKCVTTAVKYENHRVDILSKHNKNVINYLLARSPYENPPYTKRWYQTSNEFWVDKLLDPKSAFVWIGNLIENNLVAIHKLLRINFLRKLLPVRFPYKHSKFGADRCLYPECNVWHHLFAYRGFKPMITQTQHWRETGDRSMEE